ncbi:hypothetical protein [Kosakonia sp. CFBP8986]|jgi:hypothetical protein|uniref:hypothetical protein n=1 Tax=unclassified Kosakonia TaxID=2632876 RepID=UPI002A69D7E2|nr:hypothetical protein [Kosakonia sp. CFBP8986]MBS5774691.1 hypothetical protein [Enterobacter cloacae]MDY0889936.1 hypothetical protein [Kosakonia sp. CFBP8986]
MPLYCKELKTKSAKFSLVKFCKFIGFQFAGLVEGISTGVCSWAAFGSLFVLDGWFKLTGFVGFFILAYLIAWLMDVLKGEA